MIDRRAILFLVDGTKQPGTLLFRDREHAIPISQVGILAVLQFIRDVHSKSDDVPERLNGWTNSTKVAQLYFKFTRRKVEDVSVRRYISRLEKNVPGLVERKDRGMLRLAFDLTVINPDLDEK